MIGYLRTALLELVLAPQASVVDVTRRAFVDPDALPLGVEAQEIDLLAVGTVILTETIGGPSLELRHTLSAALAVEHGDPAVASSRRDLITLDLVLRFLATRKTLLARVDPASGQYGTRATVTVSYAPLVGDDEILREYATLTFDVDTTFDLA